MSLARELAELRRRSYDYASGFLKARRLTDIYDTFATFLYGSAAQYHLGLCDIYHDFDIEVVLRTLRESNLRSDLSTHGTPVNLPPFNGKTVQIMRNVYRGTSVDAEIAVRELASSRSKRWKSIKTNPVILLYPEVKTLWPTRSLQ